MTTPATFLILAIMDVVSKLIFANLVTESRDNFLTRLRAREPKLELVAILLVEERRVVFGGADEVLV